MFKKHIDNKVLGFEIDFDLFVFNATFSNISAI
jgi:hypothetical protein